MKTVQAYMLNISTNKNKEAPMKVFHEFPPVYDKNSKILILGSIPSVTSREQGFYYMHPQNRFWKVLESLFHETIKDKKEFCLEKGIALWDVCASCDIKASSDSSIKNVVPNDLSVILNTANITQIFTTGKKAHSLYQKYLYPIYKKEDICLSSTSPANAKNSLEDLVKEYHVILEYI